MSTRLGNERMKKKALFILVLVILQHGTGEATAQDRLQLTFGEAVKIALEQNIDYNTQQNLLELTEAQRLQSKVGMLPAVGLYAQGWRSDGNTFLEQEAITINTISDNLYASIGAEMDVFRGFWRINAIKKANLDFAAQQALVERRSQDVVARVINEYLQVLLDEELLRIAEDNLITQQTLHRQVEGQVEAGTKPRSDLYDQQAVVQRMSLLVIRARNTLNNDKARLAITLQLDPTQDFTLVRPPWNLDEIRLEQYDLDGLYKTALQARADLRQSELLESAAERNMALSRSAFYPNVVAYYGYSSRFNDQSSRDFVEQFTEDNTRKEFGLRLNVPIFTGLQNRTLYVRDRIAAENARLNLQNLRKTILIDVRNAYQNYQDVLAGHAAAIAQVESATLAQSVQEEKYRLGVGNLIELTNANNNYVQAMASKAQAEFSLLFQGLILEYNIGTLDSYQISAEP